MLGRLLRYTMNQTDFANPEIGNISRPIPEFGNAAKCRTRNRPASASTGIVEIVLPLFILLASQPGQALAQATGRLNDTGIVICADEISNSLPCGYSDGDTAGFPRQDAQMGRAAKENAGVSLGKTGASDPASKGYDFQKLAYIGGAVVAAGTALGTTTGLWGCTKDVVTGLIWDMKVTTASNVRLNTSTYNWKSGNSTSNGGNGGTTGTASGTTCFGSTCDTEAYIAAINAVDADGVTAGVQNICGANGWRLPTRLELMSIVDASKQGSGNATVDATYFPNIQPGAYWTSTNNAGHPDEALTVHMGGGSDGSAPKSSLNYVILVR